jgi:hypothetical protein
VPTAYFLRHQYANDPHSCPPASVFVASPEIAAALPPMLSDPAPHPAIPIASENRILWWTSIVPNGSDSPHTEPLIGYVSAEAQPVRVTFAKVVPLSGETSRTWYYRP